MSNINIRIQSIRSKAIFDISKTVMQARKFHLTVGNRARALFAGVQSSTQNLPLFFYFNLKKKTLTFAPNMCHGSCKNLKNC